MRGAIAIVSTALALSLVYGSGPAQSGGSMPVPCPTFRGDCDFPSLDSVRMIDTQTGWAATHGYRPNALLQTTDGGIHWKDATPLRTTGQKVDVWRFTILSSAIVWVTPASKGGPDATAEIFRTIDSGRTWKSVALPASSLSSISFIDPHEGWLIAFLAAAMGRQAVEIYRSIDSGETWIKVAASEGNVGSGLPVYGAKENVTFLTPTTGWVTVWNYTVPGSTAFLYVTHDGGRTWGEQSLPVPSGWAPSWMARPWSPKFFTAKDGIFPVFYVLFNDSREQTGVLAAFYTTRDGGTTWTPTKPLSIADRDDPYSIVDMEHGWVSDGDALFATSDGGRNWTTLQPAGPFADVKQLEFVSSQIGWALRRISPYLIKTLDGGRTWTSVAYTISGK